MKIHVTQYRVNIIDFENTHPEFEETQLFTIVHEKLSIEDEVLTQYSEQLYISNIVERAVNVDDDFVVNELLHTDVLIIAQDFNGQALQACLQKHKSYLKPSLKTFVFLPNGLENLFPDASLVISTSMLLRCAAHHFTKNLIHHFYSGQRMLSNFDYDEFIDCIAGAKHARLEFATNLSEANSQIFLEQQMSQAIQKAQASQRDFRTLYLFNNPNCSLRGQEGFIYLKDMHKYLMQQASANKGLADCSCFVSGTYGLAFASAFELMQLVLFDE